MDKLFDREPAPAPEVDLVYIQTTIDQLVEKVSSLTQQVKDLEARLDGQTSIEDK